MMFLSTDGSFEFDSMSSYCFLRAIVCNLEVFSVF